MTVRGEWEGRGMRVQRGYMVTEGDLTWGGRHTMQGTDDEL